MNDRSVNFIGNRHEGILHHGRTPQCQAAASRVAKRNRVPISLPSSCVPFSGDFFKQIRGHNFQICGCPYHEGEEPARTLQNRDGQEADVPSRLLRWLIVLFVAIFFGFILMFAQTINRPFSWSLENLAPFIVWGGFFVSALGYAFYVDYKTSVKKGLSEYALPHIVISLVMMVGALIVGSTVSTDEKRVFTISVAGLLFAILYLCFSFVWFTKCVNVSRQSSK